MRAALATLGAAALLAAASPVRAAEPTFADAARLYASALFVQHCVKQLPSIEAVRDALASLPGEDLPADDADLAGHTLGLEQAAEGFQPKNASWRGRVLLDRELTSAFSKPVGAAVLTGTAETGMGVELVICAVGVPGVPEAELKRVVVDLTRRDVEFTTVSDIGGGERTRWMHWNVSGGPRGMDVVALAVTAPEGPSAKADQVRQLVALGLRRK